MVKQTDKRALTKPPPLGDLEVEVLELIWQTGGATAKAAYGHFGTARRITLNTVQSAMERLYRKGLLTRSKTGHAYFYTASVSRESLLADLIQEVLGRFERDARSSAAAIIDVAQQLDEAALADLEAEIKRRRSRGLE